MLLSANRTGKDDASKSEKNNYDLHPAENFSDNAEIASGDEITEEHPDSESSEMFEVNVNR